MARRVIQLDGDASGLQKAASAATSALRTEVEAQKKIVADAKTAAANLTKDATKEERAAAKAQIQAANDVLKAKKQALAEGTAAARAAAAAEKQTAQEAANAQRAAARVNAERVKSEAADSAAQARKLAGGQAAAEQMKRECEQIDNEIARLIERKNAIIAELEAINTSGAVEIAEIPVAVEVSEVK